MRSSTLSSVFRGLLLLVTVGSAMGASPLGAAPPGLASLKPSRGLTSPQVFVTLHSDPDGLKDLSEAMLFVNSAPTAAGGCLFRLRRNSFQVYDGGSWSGGIAPGSHEQAVSACGTLYGRGSTVKISGERLLVRWHLGIRSPLAGESLRVFLKTTDRGGETGGWHQAGTWAIQQMNDIPAAIFPPDNPWNTDISAYPVDPLSDTYIASIGADGGLHPDFGTAWAGAPNGIPYLLVDSSTPLVPMSFTYRDESDPGPYPMPWYTPMEGGPAGQGDRHLVALDVDRLLLFEVFDGHWTGAGGWHGGSGAVFDLTSNDLRPDGWTSADAAGLPVLAGLVRHEEVLTGQIDHALRFTVSQTQRGYIHPATHWASASNDPDLPPMGLRLRLRGGYDTSGFPPSVQVILEALKRYGMFVADNGSDWFLSGAPHEDWNDEDLATLRQVKGADFEVVFTGPVIRPGSADDAPRLPH